MGEALGQLAIAVTLMVHAPELLLILVLWSLG